MSKPINGKMLEQAIASVVIPGIGGVVDSTKPQQEVASAANVIAWDAAGTLKRLGGDEGLLYEVVRIFLDGMPVHLAGLHRAIKGSDLEAMERIAHSLKGELAYLGISSLCDKARELERMGKERDLRHAAELFTVFETEISTVLEAMHAMKETKPDEQPVAERYPVR